MRCAPGGRSQGTLAATLLTWQNAVRLLCQYISWSSLVGNGNVNCHNAVQHKLLVHSLLYKRARLLQSARAKRYDGA